MSAAAQCANCGAGLTGRYCPGCGQDSRLRITFRAFAGQAFGGLFNLDSRLWRTLRDLCVPGKLTVEYLAGRRARYMPPVQTYLFASLMFFAALVPGVDAVLTPSDQRVWASEAATARGITIDALFAEIDTKNPRWVQERQRWRRAMSTVSVLMFLLLPLLALALWSTHYSSGRFYLEHLVFTLHLQTFAFALLGVLFAIEALLFALWWPSLPPALLIGVIVVIAVYSVVALRRVHGEPWLVTALKFSGAAAVYAALLGGVMRVAFQLSERA